MRQVACVVVLDSADRVLLGLREDFDVWGLPGGHAEPGESAAQAAQREAREELGVEVAIDGLIGRYRRTGGYADAESHAFAAHIAAGTPIPDGVETLAVGWFAVDDLPPILWWNKPPILDALAGRRDVEHDLTIEYRFGQMTQHEVYAVRDASGMSRQAFYLDAFPEPSP